MSAAPGPCTADDIAEGRWSSRITITNPTDAGPLDYIVVAVGGDFTVITDDPNYEPELPQWGPIHLAAGQTGSIVITADGNFFPSMIAVGGGVSEDGQTAQTAGYLFIDDETAFRRMATVCGGDGPTIVPEPPASGSSSAPAPEPSQVWRKTSPAEPPTPSPVTTRLAVTG